MSPNIAPLNPLTLPLTGSQLIEASAGTGKTFTIAMLYVRLVLGHQGESAFGGGLLTPPEILVVTFTEAATEELRDRIRARLAEATGYFRADPDDLPAPYGFDLLHELRAGYPPAEWPACARRLEEAAEWMDEAAVSTIHGWCNRMLREHAFDSQSLFTQHLETDQSELLAEVARDYWRIFFYPMTPEEIAGIVARWRSPAELERAVLPLLEHTGQLPDPAGQPSSILRESAQARQTALARLKRPWAEWAGELLALLGEAIRDKRVDGRKLRQGSCETWCEALRSWATTDSENPGLTDAAWRRLTREGIAEAWKAGEPPPDHPAFAAIETLRDGLTALPDPAADLLSHAARWIAREFDRARKHRAQIGFDDLLTGLESALDGPQGERLADTIRRQFPVALIDEFQDTDPIQYRIFERVYEVSQNRRDSALILIGDPKQAIYAFRGADIYTYLKARSAVAGRIHTLDTNYRSTRAMVAAVNHCFAQAEQREGGNGAFGFRHGEDNPVPFHPVEAHGRSFHFQVDGETLPAMTLAVLAGEGEIAKTAYIARMAEICATRIVAWLNRGNAGRAGFAGPAGEFKPFCPGDAAILVNNGNEAAHIRQALSRRGVRSVYLSDRDSVYDTHAATEIRHWLAACAEPDNERLLRAALSTVSLGLSFAELDALGRDEDAWEARVVQFKGYRDIWRRQGVLPMLRRILADFGSSERLLGLEADAYGQSGERILTDLLHLAELLQQASFTLEGEHALIRFLGEQIDTPQGDSAERRLRLESDGDLVKVVTIHKSKGLEYPLVFLPFISAARITKEGDLPLKWHDERGEPRIALKADPETLRRADAERLGEDLRKLYVAFTRAGYATWIGLAPVKNSDPGAIGHLFGLAGLDAGQYVEAVRSFADGNAALAVTDDLPENAERFETPARTGRTGTACRPTRPARENWRIGSYSALPVEGHAAAAAGESEDSPQAENLSEGRHELSQPALAERRPTGPMHRFAKGPEAGTFLHDLMQWVAESGFRTVHDDPAALRDTIARRCNVRRWEPWAEPLFRWVKSLLATPLPLGPEPGNTLRLADLHAAKAEMEFWFEARQVDLARLDAAVVEHTLERRPRPRLLPETLNGMLKGFMDLVFEHGGRYYVADYKSNWLGPADEDYTAAAMDEAIRAHRYDLQYAIYLFALHRLLKSRLPGYDYDRHVGGAAYLFVRGIASATAGVHFERPPKALMDILDGIFAGRTEGGGT